MYLGNIAGLIVVLTCVPLFAAILRIPFSIIAPVIIVICAIGAYTVHNSMFDVYLMVVFGVLGYAFKKLVTRLRPWCWRSCWGTAPRELQERDQGIAGRSLDLFLQRPRGWADRARAVSCCSGP